MLVRDAPSIEPVMLTLRRPPLGAPAANLKEPPPTWAVPLNPWPASESCTSTDSGVLGLTPAGSPMACRASGVSTVRHR